MGIERGTWNVRPALTPPSRNIPKKRRNKGFIINQRLKAFNLGKIVSEEQGIKGIERLPKPPINNGMIIKGIINIPWKVIQLLYWRGERGRYPGKPISTLIMIGNPIPKGPPIKPDNICTVPIKIWLVVININTIEILVNLIEFSKKASKRKLN